MSHYLIEFRFFGKAKGEAKRLIYEVNRRFHITPRHRPVPHVTLVGPFITKNERKLVFDFKDLCNNFDVMDYSVAGYDTFETSNVVFIKINPSQQLEEFRWELAKRFKSYCSLRSFDLERKFYFHGTIAMKLTPQKFKEVKNYIRNKPKLTYKHTLLRVTLLKDSKILYEYDFLLKRMLNRAEAKNPLTLTQTYFKLKKYLNKTGNSEETKIKTLKINLWKRIINFISKKMHENIGKHDRIYFICEPKTFITSDLHLDHTNIIEYCKRPFLNSLEMNRTLVNNWNKAIRKKDTVYFLGDLVYGAKSFSTDYWLGKLNGKIIFIKGNHDASKKIKLHESYILNYKGNKFYLCHDPKDVPKHWKDWAICGHHHNNNVNEYPFIDKKNKRINVSVELTNYSPVNIDDLIKKISINS